MALTAKQERFKDHYLKTGNQTQAASEAGYANPEMAGSRLMRNDKVVSEIAKGQAKRAKRTEIGLDYVIQRLAVEAELQYEQGGTQSGRVAALRELRDHFKAIPADEDAPSLTINIEATAPVGDVRVTRHSG